MSLQEATQRGLVAPHWMDFATPMPSTLTDLVLVDQEQSPGYTVAELVPIDEAIARLQALMEGSSWTRP